MKYIDETSEQMTKVRVICSGLELAVAMRSPYSLLCETSFLELIERYLGVLLRELDGADAGEIQDDMRKLRSQRDELDELDAANSSVILTVALDDDDTGRQTTNFETEEILTPPPLQDLVDAAVNSRPLESGRRGTRRRRRSGEQSEKRQTRDGASRPSGKRLRARRPHARRPSARRPSARRGKRRRARPARPPRPPRPLKPRRARRPDARRPRARRRRGPRTRPTSRPRRRRPTRRRRPRRPRRTTATGPACGRGASAGRTPTRR